MKTLITLLLFSGLAVAQTVLVPRFTGQPGEIPVAVSTAAGMGSVSSVTIQGTASEIEVSGTCTITTTGTCTVGIVTNPTIGLLNATGLPIATGLTGLTGANRIPYATGASAAATSASFTYNDSTKVLNVGNATSSETGEIIIGGSGTGVGNVTGGGGQLNVTGGGVGGLQFNTTGTADILVKTANTLAATVSGTTQGYTFEQLALFKVGASTGDGTVAGQYNIFELSANGNNYRRLTVSDALSSSLSVKFFEGSAPSDNDCVKTTVAGGVVSLESAGDECGAGGSGTGYSGSFTGTTTTVTEATHGQGIHPTGIQVYNSAGVAVLSTINCLDSMAAAVGCGDATSTGDVVITVSPTGTYTYVIGGGTGGGGGGGGVSSVGQSFTGGLISVSGSPITTSGTLALTVAGTSGGVPYFSSSSTWASSAALTASAIMLGGGAGSAPTVLGSLGTTTTILHGNAAGAPTFGAVVSADLNITTSTCTNQFLTAISSGGVGTCTTSTLAGAQHANQGTTTTILHGNAAGNPSWAAVSLTADVSGILPVANGGTNNAFFTVSGPATSAKTYTFPNASSTVLTSNAAVTVPQGGTGVATLTNHGVVLGQGTSNVAVTSAGTTDQCLVSNGASADPAFETCPAGNAAGSDTQVQFNDGGSAFGGDAGLTYNKTTDVLTATGGFASGGGAVAGFVELLQGTTNTPSANSVLIEAPTSVSTAYKVILPGASATGFMLGTDAANVNTVTFVGFSGTGNVARVASPTFTTPTLGAATATSINGLTLTSSTGALTITNGKTASISNTLTFTGTDSSSVAFGTGGTVAYTIASGTKALDTDAILTTACDTLATTTATGAASTDTLIITPNADITGVTGYTAATTGGLQIFYWLTTNTINWKVCNPTSSTITPGAVTLNYRIVR